VSNVETMVVKILQADTTVTAQVAAGNIWKGHLPQEFDWSAPAITVQRISEQTNTSLDGLGTTAQARVQIDVWSLSQNTAEDAADAVRDVFASIYWSTTQPAGCTIVAVWLDNRQTLNERYDDGDQWAVHVVIDFLVDYKI
jgi:hypothetical protein